MAFTASLLPITSLVSQVSDIEVPGDDDIRMSKHTFGVQFVQSFV